MKKKLLIAINLFVLVLSTVLAQQKAIGTWSDHLPYQRGTSITKGNGVIYAGTSSGVFSYNSNDGSISRFSKVNKLNDVNTSLIGFVEETNTLIVIYENANIDLVKSTNVINLPFLQDYNRVTNKQANSIFVNGSIAYISFSFGILVIDTENNEVKDTYVFNNATNNLKINSSLVFNQNIYAFTNNGYFSANLNSNLLDQNNWIKRGLKPQSNFTTSLIFNNTPLVLIDDTIYNVLTETKVSQLSTTSVQHFSGNNKTIRLITSNHIFKQYEENFILTHEFPQNPNNVMGTEFDNNKIYILNNFHPLLELNNNGEVINTIKPNGPFEKNIFDLEANNGNVWAVSGGHDFSYNNLFQYIRIYHLNNGNWTSYNEFSEPSLSLVYDGISVTVNPENLEQVYVGTWGNGLIEYNGSLPFHIYRDTNSSLQPREAIEGYVGPADTKFDESGNLWVSNTYNQRCLSVKTSNNNWISYDFSNYIEAETSVKELLIDDAGHKWISLPRLNEILVFNDNGTLNNPNDDEVIHLLQEEGFGNLPGIRGITFEKDLNGQIWVGTSDGIAVFYSPETIFDPGKQDAERILIDDGENVEALFQNTNIQDIEIDGNNRKWVATDGSGVYLVSEDGREEILHFTQENSPLLSNNVISIACDRETGEVYFATDQGLVSYRNDGIAGKDNFTDVKIFPNPVRPDYNGPISISGLMQSTTVKITDINGTLVNEIITEGGQAIWNGTNFNGERVSTGVYLVFNSAEDEEEDLKTQIGKILFVK